MEQRTKLQPDVVFGLLVDRQRRLVLHYLRIVERTVIEFDRLIEWIEERILEHGEASENVREQLEVSLHHVHLPRLSESGVLDYDWRSRTIRYRACDAIESHLELVAEEDL